MSSTNSTSAFVRPLFFIVSGFTNISYVNYYYIFLCFCYAASLVGNLFVLTIICVVRSLHTPKYMAVFTLAVSDLGESTALIPKLIETFLFNAQEITYEACLANMFFVLFFFCMQSLALSLLAYDRFVAICFPLRYHSIVTNTSMGIMIAVAGMVDVLLMSLMVALITRLSFCKTIVVDSYFCDHGPMYRMACNDNSVNRFISIFNIVILIYVPLALIGLSYTCILLAVFKIATWEERIKSLKTCFSHLILVLVFYMPVIGIYMAALSISFHPNIRIINTSLSYAIPPVLNPIVYSLNTDEIKQFVKKMLQRWRPKGITPAVSK